VGCVLTPIFKTRQLFGQLQTAENGTSYYNAQNTILDAHFAFLDEMFKAESEILNMLLQIMADKYYTTGDGRMIDVDLISLFGASNEYPTGALAEPYLDRLLFWYDVKRINVPENRLKFFAGEFNKSPIEEPLFSLEEIDEVYSNSQKSILIPDDILLTINSIVDSLISHGVKTSDRKYSNSIKAMKVSAYINGRTELDLSDLIIFLFTSWHNDIEKRKTQEVVYKELFSSKSNVDAQVEAINKQLEEINTNKSNLLTEFLQNKKYFSSVNVDDEFNNYVNATIFVLNGYNGLLDKITSLNQLIEHIYHVEALIDNNIFFIDIKNETLTEQMKDNISTIESELSFKHEELRSWLVDNSDINNYNSNK